MFNSKKITEILLGEGLFCFAPWFFDQSNSQFRMRVQGSVALNRHHSYFTAKPLHIVAGFEHEDVSFSHGQSSCLDFACVSRDQTKVEEQSKNHATPYCLAAYSSGLKDVYKGIDRIVRGSYISPVNVYVSPNDPILEHKPESLFKNNEYYIFDITNILHEESVPNQRDERLEDLCHRWMVTCLDEKLFKVDPLEGFPELFTWYENGSIYAVVLSGSFYQHNLQIFRDYTDFLVNRLIPKAKLLGGGPMPAYSLSCGNFHVMQEMQNLI